MDCRCLKSLSIQLFHGSFEVGCSFELHESFAITFASSFGIDDVQLTRVSGEIFEVLPTGIRLKASDLHAVDCATGTRNVAVRRPCKVVLPAWSSSKLNSQSLALEFCSMEGWNDVSSVHGIFILDETKAIHELDFLNGAGAMSAKVLLDVLFRDVAR